jgi:hypothetical protein
MRDVWVTTGTSPTVFRYIDWLLTVPLLMIEFYFILSAVKKVSGGIFWRLLVGTLIMLVGGYLGEAGYIGINLGFIIGMAGWIYILYEVFAGEAGQEAKKLKGQETPQGVERQHPRHHEAGDPSFGETWWRQENLWFNLRRNQRCLEGVLGKRYP